MLAKVIPFPVKPAVSQSCRWHEAVESVTSSNLRIACAWQRMLFRFWWGA
ncbi:hypothetical protein PA01_18970 [Azoarcus sp. PA01]|nr:hypothetical protein PA01_18970 [Azoarcus sp. PA01]